MRRTIVLVSLCALFAACVPTSSTTTTSPEPVPSTTVAPPTTAVDGPTCAAGDARYTTNGLLAAPGEESGNAVALASVRWRDLGECERLVLDFLTQAGSPASRLGLSAATLIAESGIVRVNLPPEVEAAGIADSLIDGPLVERVYVADVPGSGMIVDIHLGAEVEARSFAVESPARLVIDVRTSDEAEAVLGHPTLAGDVVVLTPAAGPNLYPLRLAGYARPGTPAVRVWLVLEGEVVVDRSIVLTASDAWSWYEATITDGPSGAVELFIGELDELGGPSAGGANLTIDVP